MAALMRRPSLQTVVSAIVLAGCSLFVFSQLEPSLLFARTTPAGGDMGAHVWAPAYLRDHLLPNGRMSGWAPGAWAGFPALTFYFPLPSLLIVLLDVLLPYVIAFKLVTVLGALTLPGAAYLFGRLSGLRFPGPPVLAVATLPFLFDTSFTIYGGNIPSTLAGEFAFSLSLSFALVFLGVIASGLESGRLRGIAAGLFALTVLTHILPAVFAVAGAAVLLLLKFDRRRLWYLATVGAVGVAIAGFWLVPLLFRVQYSNDLGWVKISEYVEALFPPHMRWFIVLAIAGTISAIGLRLRAGIIVLAIAIATALLFVLAPESRVWNARFLPFWYLSVYLLAGVGAGEVGRALGGVFSRDPDSPSRWVQLATPAAALILAIVFVGGPLKALPSFLPVRPGTISFVGDWARWNYSGYEGKAAYPEYRALMDTMRSLPCGRAMWEYGPDLNRYGTPMALMLLPYWTDGCIDSMEGLYFESSPTVPFHFLNQSELSTSPSRAQRDLPYRDLDVARGVEHLQLLGVRYYMAFSHDAVHQAHINPDLSLITVSGPWQIFEVEGSDLVVSLENEPVVVAGVSGGRKGWLDLAIPFYQDPSLWNVFLAADGPRYWTRISPGKKPPLQEVPPVRIQRVRASNDRISFDVDRPGSLVLVKTSFFPNWKASGADGPWRVAPNLMVVQPRARHVELRYGYTPVDIGGWLITLLGLAGLVQLARRRFSFPRPPPGVERFRNFATITVFVTSIDIGVLLLLRLQFGIPVILADAVSISMAATVSYLLHRSISFGDDPHIRWVNEPATFAWVALVAGLLDVAALWITASFVGSTSVLPLFVAKTMAVAVAGSFRLSAYRRRLLASVRQEQARPGDRPPSPGRMRLSVVIPAYREGGRIGESVLRIRQALSNVAADGGLEVIVVDDGSPDDTAERARKAGGDRVIVLPKNRGKGAAVRAGVQAAAGRAVAFTDADLSYPPEQLRVLLEKVEAGWDMVVGSRRHVRTTTLVRARRLRETAGRLFNHVTRALLLGQYRDTQCGIKAFRSDAARVLFAKCRLEGFAFDVELFHLAERYHLSLEEVPVTVAHTEGSTVRTALDAIRMLRDIFRIRRWAGEGLYDLAPGEQLPQPRGESEVSTMEKNGPRLG